MNRRPRCIPAVLTLSALALALVPAAPASAAPPAAMLSAQPGSYDFGLVNVEWGEQGTNFTIRNDGGSDVQLSSASIDGPGAFRVSNDGCTGQLLNPGNTCNVNVGFDPAQQIAYAATLHVPGDAGEAIVPLAGQGGAQQITTTPASVDFGTVDVGDSATRTIGFANTGDFPYQSIVAIPTGLDVGAFRVVRDTCSMVRLDPGDDCELAVRFTPLAPGIAEGTLMVIGGQDMPVLIPLHGSGRQVPAPPVAPPAPTAAAVVVPGAVDFGVRRLGTRRVVRTLTVVNAGGGTLRISDLTLGGPDAGWFRVAGEDCLDAALAPTATCTVRVRFTPREAGVMAAKLRIGSNDPAGVVTAALSGRVERLCRAIAARDGRSARRAVVRRCTS